MAQYYQPQHAVSMSVIRNNLFNKLVVLKVSVIIECQDSKNKCLALLIDLNMNKNFKKSGKK